LKDLIDLLIALSPHVPNGVLLVFPSFKIQMDFKYELMRSSKREKLTASKDIIFEEKSSDINMADFKKKALSKKGAILAIVCRGKVSEGIDFPDGMCRAVILVGVPYPNIKDPFIVEKKSHLESIASRSTDKSEALTGEEWYLMGTVRAINQALGRVIRHAMDYGMIFLLDTRYCDTKMRK
jgi:Rad3-related DNA helicase